MKSSLIILCFIALLCQGSWIFYDAAKRGENKWIWGLFGLINLPSSLIVYLLVTRVIRKEVTCPNCLYNNKKDASFCSYCGEQIPENNESSLF